MNTTPSQLFVNHTAPKCNFLLGLMLLLLAFCSACSSVRVAPIDDSAYTFKIEDFSCQPVTVLNAQPADSIIKIGSTGGGMGQMPKSVVGNLHEWTETAREILNRELQQRTVATPGKAPKVLRLSVTKIRVGSVAFVGGNGCQVHLKVETDTGISREFDVEHIDAKRGRINEIAGGALLKVIATMLNDEAVRSYFRN
jgi:hypothetical protein